MDDPKLSNESIRRAEKMVKTLGKFDIIEKSMAINALAHGFYMGAKFAQAKPKFFKVFHRKSLDPNGLFLESHSAAIAYLKKRHPFLPEANKTLLKTSLSMGFREGYREYAKPAE